MAFISEQSNNKANNTNDETILSARIHEYRKPLTIDRIAKPIVGSGEQVLLKVGAVGLCHSDLHLINGEWNQFFQSR